MKALAVFPTKKQTSIIDVEKPSGPGPGQVRLRMIEVGICGTDKEIASFQYGTPPSGSDYLIIGHESFAEVAEVGNGVSNVQKGDLVVSMVRRPCDHPECIPCRAGRQDFCITGDYTERGIKQLHGFLRSEVIDEAKYLHKVPESLKDVGVLVEPLTIAEKALIQVSDVQDRLPGEARHSRGGKSGRNHAALVLGAGPVGLLGAMALVSQGYRTFVFSREEESSPKARITRTIGATYCSATQYTLEQVAKEMGTIDLIYEAAGASTLAFNALKNLGINAIFVFTGVPGRKGPIQMDADLIMRNMVLKNQILLGTVNAGANAYDAAIRSLDEFCRRWPEAVRSMISRKKLDDYADLLQSNAKGIKNVIVLER